MMGISCKDSGLAILIIDKSVRVLSRVADRHYIMEKGRSVWSGTSEQLQAASSVRMRYLGV